MIEEARTLDRRQKEVLSIGLHYAKKLVTFSAATSSSKRPSCSSTFSESAATFSESIYSTYLKPTPPLVMVHGGAGSGKSRVINSLYNMITSILKQPGDDPNYPYVVLTSFT